jgi:hypothetical protein
MAPQKWSAEKAKAWYDGQPWLRGCNFIPSNAINQLEMWQAETFDPETIDRELGWAADLGFNVMRVYLHDLLWLQDARGLKDRIRLYLDISDRHKIKTLFVLFDDCWHDNPQLGKQPEPKPGVHNSGWLKSPGSKVLHNPAEWKRLEDYVGDIVTAFSTDDRVVIWDIYNEPGNNFLTSLNLPAGSRQLQILRLLFEHMVLPSPSEKLLKRAFAWARAAQPIQPLTAGLYYLAPGLGARLNPVSLALSDVVSFHTYFKLGDTDRIVNTLQQARRPLICTEYLARSALCTFETHLGYFKEHEIGAINWGLVSGKTQTMYSWEAHYPNGEEPPLWYHDILRKDGAPYRTAEAELIRKITSQGS